MRPVLLFAAVVLFVQSLAAAGEHLPPPTGDVVLQVSGVDTVTKGEVVAEFDLALLESLGVEEMITSTIWTKGKQRFEGVPLYRVLEHLEVSDGVVRATAINEYAVDIPVESITPDSPLIAFRNNGEPMSVRSKGPLWIVYPYDSAPEYRTEVVYSRSIWQLKRIDVIR